MAVARLAGGDQHGNCRDAHHAEAGEDHQGHTPAGLLSQPRRGGNPEEDRERSVCEHAGHGVPPLFGREKARCSHGGDRPEHRLGEGGHDARRH